MTETKTFKVSQGPLGIHLQLSGPKVTQLAQGAIVVVDATSRTEHDGAVWWRNAIGWSQEKSLDGSQVFMEDVTFTDYTDPEELPGVTEEPAPVESTAPQEPVAPPQPVATTEEPTAPPQPNTTDSHTEETKPNATEAARAALKETTEMMRSAAGAITEALADAYRGLAGRIRLIAEDTVVVRDRPSRDPHVTILRSIFKGDQVNANFDTVTEADGYYWVQHDEGWSAIQDTQGSTIFFSNGGKVVEVGEDGPKLEDLPGYRSLITRLPVDMDKIRFFQYFGNNVFAWQYGRQYNYDGYSQALLGGLDFGNSQDRNIPVYAGVQGTYLKSEYSQKYDWNHRMLIQSGDYIIIYQHITNLRKFEKGQPITPDTQLADIYNGPNWADHLHFEVRFQTDWIINPLALMTEELYQQIIAEFDPAAPSKLVKSSELFYFFKNDQWTRWTTEMDQPVLKLGGKPTGPRYT